MRRDILCKCVLLVLAASVGFAHGQTRAQAYALRNVDPYLRPLLARPIHELPDLARMLEYGRLPVLVRTAGSPYALERYGARIRGAVGSIASADIAPEDLARVASAPELLFMEGPKRMYPAAPALNRSLPSVGLDTIHRANPGYRGRDVMVAFIDSGLDITHPAFMAENGSTRVIAVWDQVVTLPGRSPEELGYGTEWTSADIDAGRADVSDRSGHGTHVVGIAAGNGGTRDGSGAPGDTTPQYVGVAPEASILLVRTTYTNVAILDAAIYIIARADQYGMPVVINMSLGSSWGPHDGRGLLQGVLQDLTTSRPGIVMVAAPGNGGDSAEHARMFLSRNEPQRLYLRAHGATPAVYVEAWQDAGVTSRVRPLFPRNNAGDLGPFGFDWVEEGAFAFEPIGGGPVADLSAFVDYTDAPSPTYEDLDEFFAVFTQAGDLTVPLSDHIFALEFEGEGIVDAYVHEGTFVQRPSDPDAVMPDGFMTISAPADADLIIAATSVVTRSVWPGIDGNLWTSEGAGVGERSTFASIGPRRDGYEKPDIAAPGEFVVAPLSAGAIYSFDDTRIAPDGSYAVLRGTSMATAHTTGMVALLLEQNPDLPAAEVVERVREAGVAGFWTRELGYGVLDPHALLDVPWPPTGLRADIVGGQPVVSWGAFLDPDISYRIHVDGAPSDIPTGAAAVLSDFGDGAMLITVTSVNAAGRESAHSDSIVVTPAGSLLGPTTSVSVQNLNGGVALEWDPVDGAVAYRVEWGLGADALVNALDTTAPGAAFGGLANGVTYFFRVVAIGDDGVSGVGSETARALPRPAPVLTRTGFAMRRGFPIEAGHDYIAAPTVADLDGDGTLEILTANVDGSVYAYHDSGRPVSGWPQSTGEALVGAVAVADIDLDGVPEIAAVGGNRLYVWHANGDAMRGFPGSTPNVMRAHPVLANIDDDPTLEVLATVSAGTAGVYAWDMKGQFVPRYPLVPAAFPGLPANIATEPIFTSPVVADADLDGRSEIYVSTRFGGVFSWSGKGEARAGFPVLPEGVAVGSGGVPQHATPMLADLGGDTLNLLTGGRTAGIIAHDIDGVVRDGFPVPVRRWIEAPVSVGDLDGDGSLEIVAVDESGLLYAWRDDGSLVDGFPTDLVNSGRPAAVTGDLDGDGDDEIIVASNRSRNFGAVILVFDGDGTLLDSVNVDVNVGGTPTLADLDGDGQAELIATTLRRLEDPDNPTDFPEIGGRLFVWDLPFTLGRSAWSTEQGGSAKIGVSPHGIPPSSEMSGARGLWDAEGARLSWTTTAEHGNVGWHVFRGSRADGPLERVSDEAIGSRRPSSTSELQYTWYDRTADDTKTQYYQLVGYGTMDRRTASAPIEMLSRAEQLAKTWLTTWGRVRTVEALAPFPSPANPEVWVPFMLGRSEDVTVTIYDAAGAVVREIEVGRLQPGAYTTRGRAARWDGRNEQAERVASGLYFTEVRAGATRTATRRVFLSK
jgi:hypothetical protein